MLFVAIPDVVMNCTGQLLEACFHSTTDQVLSRDQFHIEPNCSSSSITETPHGDVCLRIDMSVCRQSHNKVPFCLWSFYTRIAFLVWLICLWCPHVLLNIYKHRNEAWFAIVRQTVVRWLRLRTNYVVGKTCILHRSGNITISWSDVNTGVDAQVRTLHWSKPTLGVGLMNCLSPNAQQHWRLLLYPNYVLPSVMIDIGAKWVRETTVDSHHETDVI